MLGKPLTFAALNIVLLFGVLSIMGFGGAVWVSLAVALWIIIYNTKQVGTVNAMALAISYLVLFDNDEFFSYTDFKLRPWYLLVILLLFYYLTRSIGKLKKVTVTVEFICLFIIYVLVVFWLMADSTNGRLSIIKYMLFSVGTIYVIQKAFKSIAKKVGVENLLDFFISLVAFVSVWGIIQFMMNMLGRGDLYMFDYYNIRPSGFFSETTWYAEYSFFGLILVSCKETIFHHFRFSFLFVFFIISLVVSATRNAYLGVVIWTLSIVFLNLLRKKVYVPKLRTMIIGIGLLATIAVVFGEQLALISDKITALDNSSEGRLLALEPSWNSFCESPILGHGFSFDPERDSVSLSGSSIGAKSFNLFLMIIHIFGLLGMLPFLLLLMNFLLKNAYRYKTGSLFAKYAFIILVIFLSMSMFAPLHQYPFGMYIVAVALFLSSIKNNENSIYNTFS